MKYCDGHFGGSPKTVFAELMVSLCQILVEKEMVLKMCLLSGFYSERCFHKFAVFVCDWSIVRTRTQVLELGPRDRSLVWSGSN